MKFFLCLIFMLIAFNLVAQNDSTFGMITDESISYNHRYLYNNYPNKIIIFGTDSIISMQADNGKFANNGSVFTPKKLGVVNFSFYIFENRNKIQKIRKMEVVPYPKLTFKILEIKQDSLLIFQIWEKHSGQNWSSRLILSYRELKIYDKNNTFLGEFIGGQEKSDTSYVQINLRKLFQDKGKPIKKLKKDYKIKIVYWKILDRERGMLVIVKNQFFRNPK